MIFIIAKKKIELEVYNHLVVEETIYSFKINQANGIEFLIENIKDWL